jgi:SAM-dependent methyltransferase
MQFREFYCRLIGKIKPTILQMLVRRCEIFYERQIGLDFLSVNSVEDLGLDSKLVSKCSPSGNKYLVKCFSDFKITKEDSILDIGCGKGSAIRALSSFNFYKIDGLEISEYLANIARANFKILKDNKPNIFNCNALKFNDYNNYNYLYLYNPFPPSVFEGFLIILNSQINNKKLFIIYNNPVCGQLLIEDGFKLIKNYPDQWGNGMILYSKNY